MSSVAPIDESATATQLPEPQGYRILCAIPDIEDKFDNGIIKTEETIKNEEILATVLFVVKLGTDCYKDESRFPSGPYCKEGDFVLVRPHTGTKINIHGKAFRLITDDSIEAVVDDPTGVVRA